MGKSYLFKFVLTLCLFVSSWLNVHAFTVNGISYAVRDDDATAVNVISGSYSGTVVIPESVTYSSTTYTVKGIAIQAFKDCSSVTYISIPNTVTSVGAEAFNGCTGLVTLSIPNSVTTLGDYAFANCSNLEHISLSSALTGVGTNAFIYCPKLKSVKIERAAVPGVYMDFYVGWGSDDVNTDFSSCTLYVPSESVDTYKAATGWHLFGNVEAIPSTGEETTVDGLKYMIDPSEGVAQVSSYESLSETLTIPATITYNESTYVVTSIGDGAFSNCSSLTSVSLPNNITSLGAECFEWCSALTEITLPSSIITLQSKCFACCQLLTKLICKANTPPTVASDAFFWTPCKYGTLLVPTLSSSGYNSADVWNDWKYIATFEDGKEDEVSINTVNYDGYLVDKNDGTAVLLKWPRGSSDFDERHALIPSTFYASTYTVTNISSLAFSKCEYITDVTIPSTITKLDEGCFYNSSVSEVTLPYTLREIGAHCFEGSHIKYITCNALTPPTLGADAFTGSLYQSGTLTIPYYSLSAYQSADAWKDWGNIQSITNLADRDKVIYVDEVGATYSFSTSDPYEWEWGATWDNCACLRSTNSGIDNSISQTTMSFTVPQDTHLTFDYGVMSEFNDCFYVFLDGTCIGGGCGSSANPFTDTPWPLTGCCITNISSGSHTLVMEYVKDGSYSYSYGDYASISNIWFGSVTDISLNSSSETLVEGETTTLTATVYPTDSPNKFVYWGSGDSSVATVDTNDGTITAVSAGTTGIYCSNLKGDIYRDCTITVIARGDVDGDGSITAADITGDVKFIIDDDTSGLYALAADYNRNGSVTTTDATAIVRLALTGTTTIAETKSRVAGLAETTRALAVDDITMATKDTKDVSIKLADNLDQFTSVQFDVTLPEGVSIENVKLGNRAVDHSVVSHVFEDGRVRVICYSLSNELFTATDGDVVTLTLKSDGNASRCMYDVNFSNILLVRKNVSKVYTDKQSVTLNITDATDIKTIADGSGIDAQYKNGLLVLTANEDGDATVYAASGALIYKNHLIAGQTVELDVPKDVYLVNGKKMLIR